jgi:hypothetical protein
MPLNGDMQWGTKTKKNPGKNKNNADRQRFEGGFVKTDPPFDCQFQSLIHSPIHTERPLRGQGAASAVH